MWNFGHALSIGEGGMSFDHNLLPRNITGYNLHGD